MRVRLRGGRRLLRCTLFAEICRWGTSSPRQKELFEFLRRKRFRFLVVKSSFFARTNLKNICCARA